MKQAAIKNKVFEVTKPFSNSTIPNDWVISTVGDAFEICNNLRYPISEEERRKIQGNYPYYGPTKIQDYINEYRLDGKYSLIGEDGDHFLKWKELPMTLLVEGKFNVNNHAHVVKGTTNITEWFFYYFNHKELTPYLTRQGAGRYKLTKQSLSKIPVPLPTISEQKAITTILSSCDLNIKLIEQLLAQKELRKKWLMQQLLTGKKRMKGFKGKWMTLKMKEIGIIPEKKAIVKVDFQKLLTVKLHTKGIEFNERDKPIISNTGRPYYERNKGEILIGRQNIHNGGIGLVTDEFDGHICSNAISSFVVNSTFSLNFILFYLQYPANYQRIEDYMGGTGQKELSEKQLLEIQIKLPESNEEQTAIAQVLQTVDKEISLLKLKAEKLREKKKGLMQQLLTGKIRIK